MRRILALEYHPIDIDCLGDFAGLEGPAIDDEEASFDQLLPLAGIAAHVSAVRKTKPVMNSRQGSGTMLSILVLRVRPLQYWPTTKRNSNNLDATQVCI